MEKALDYLENMYDKKMADIISKKSVPTKDLMRIKINEEEEKKNKPDEMMVHSEYFQSKHDEQTDEIDRMQHFLIALVHHEIKVNILNPLKKRNNLISISIESEKNWKNRLL